jgi:hypothetical protein
VENAWEMWKTLWTAGGERGAAWAGAGESRRGRWKGGEVLHDLSTPGSTAATVDPALFNTFHRPYY